MSTELDPKGLIREAYRIEGIEEAECRSIFVDWALSLPGEIDAQQAVAEHYSTYWARYPDHPMTSVLREGLSAPARPVRRGGGRRRRNRSGES